jgi:hypothetical protein
MSIRFPSHQQSTMRCGCRMSPRLEGVHVSEVTEVTESHVGKDAGKSFHIVSLLLRSIPS